MFDKRKQQCAQMNFLENPRSREPINFSFSSGDYRKSFRDKEMKQYDIYNTNTRLLFQPSFMTTAAQINVTTTANTESRVARTAVVEEAGSLNVVGKKIVVSCCHASMMERETLDKYEHAISLCYMLCGFKLF